MNSINYLRRGDIDDEKWNACIRDAGNGLIYAYTYFLDAIADKWDALVFGDYQVIMPLVYRKKYFFQYLYQPFFTSNLGLFGKGLSPAMLAAFINEIPSHIQYADIDLNEQCWPPLQQGIFPFPVKLKQRINYLIPAIDYEDLQLNYHRLAKRMLRKAKQEEVEIKESSRPGEVIDFYKIQYQAKQPEIRPKDYASLLKAAETLYARDQCHCFLATKNEEILGSYLLFSDDHFYYSVLGGSSEKGKGYGAFYALTDMAIRKSLASGKSFRFEGSDKPGIAAFNAQFGADPATYFHLKANRLPWPVRIFK